MKKTINVNIGGTAFTLEEDAYEAMGKYLDALRIHFESNAEAAEILADIEARINELLRLKLSQPNKTVSLTDVQEIIKLVGSPSDLGYNPQSGTDAPNNTSNTNTTDAPRRKRLYLDSERGILGGVCAGIGHYLNMRPPVVRLIWVLAWFLLSMVTVDLNGRFSFLFFFFAYSVTWLILTFIVPYLILWIVIPKATTLEQKVEMKASQNQGTLQNIENRSYAPPAAPSGQKLGNILKAIAKVIVAFIGIDALIFLLASTVFLLFFVSQPNLFGINDYLAIMGIATSYSFLLPIYLCFALPLLGICYIATKIVFSYRFRGIDWVLSGIATTLWISSWIYLAAQGLSYGDNYRGGAKITEPIAFLSTSDTLYIAIDSTYDAEQQRNAATFHFTFNQGQGMSIFDSPTFYFLDNDSITNQPTVFILPTIHTLQDSTSSTFQIDMERMAFGKTGDRAKQQAENMKLSYHLTDSLLVIKPPRYSPQNPWPRESYTIRIRFPLHKVVIFQGDCIRYAPHIITEYDREEADYDTDN